jgi:hypothetical protein
MRDRFYEKTLCDVSNAIHTRPDVNYAQLRWACQAQVRNGLQRDLQGEAEYQQWAHGHSSGSSGGSIGSLGCLSNEHFVRRSCEPKGLVRCGTLGDCAFGERCDQGVCHN